MNDGVRTLCSACGATVAADDVYCEACGTALTDRDATTGTRREIDLGVVAAVTDRGLVRQRNEDAFRVGSTPTGDFAVVCDGVATSTSGHLAAHAAADAAGDILGAALSTATFDEFQPTVAMAAAMAAAQDAAAAVPSSPARPDAAPACTLVAAMWHHEQIVVGSVGDSRAYWLDSDASRCLTRDDSWAEDQVDTGLMTRDAAMASPNAHAITRWMGADAPAGPFSITSTRPNEPGQLVLCSDGLWQYASALSELERLIPESRIELAPLQLARLLADAALLAGGRDNVTVAVIRVNPGATAPSQEEP